MKVTHSFKRNREKVCVRYILPIRQFVLCNVRTSGVHVPSTCSRLVLQSLWSYRCTGTLLNYVTKVPSIPVFTGVVSYEWNVFSFFFLL
jgi:hypothetical protein